MNGRRTAIAAITGVGTTSPLGRTLGDFDEAVFAGRSAVRALALDLPGFDLPPMPAAAAAFDVSAEIGPTALPLDRGTAMALFAAREAARAAGLGAGDVEPERLGVFWGSGMSGAATFETTCRSLFAERRRVRPSTVLTTMPNAPVAEIAIEFGARGAALSYACACASSAVAIGEAARAVREGRLDVAIAGGSEAMLTPGVITCWLGLRVLAPIGAGDAAAVCRPFAVDRNGFAMGEAAAAFVIETIDHARGRGRAPRVALSGYATNCDGLHITNPDPGGQARAMRAALGDAGLAPSDIGYLNAHGTATLNGDAAEARSLATVFGEGAVAVSSTKAIHGHLLGAAGAVELLVALRALEAGCLPPTAHTTTVDPAFAIDLVTGAARAAPGLRHAMSNSFAFGGTNAVLIASRLD